MRVIAGSARGHNLKGPRSDATRPTSDMVRGSLFAMLESMLGLDAGLEGLRVLDLYAGTGALGIEALSRGAAWCDFVEEDRATGRIIAENLAHTKLAGRAAVHTHTVERALAHPEMLGRRGKREASSPQPPRLVDSGGEGAGAAPFPSPAKWERERVGDWVRQGNAPADHCTAGAGYDIILLDPPYALSESATGGVWSVLARLAGEGFAVPDGLVVLEHSRRAAPPEAIGRLSLVKSRRHGDTCVTIYRMGSEDAGPIREEQQEPFLGEPD